MCWPPLWYGLMFSDVVWRWSYCEGYICSEPCFVWSVGCVYRNVSRVSPDYISSSPPFHSISLPHFCRPRRAVRVSDDANTHVVVRAFSIDTCISFCLQGCFQCFKWGSLWHFKHKVFASWKTFSEGFSDVWEFFYEAMELWIESEKTPDVLDIA